jgi:UDP-N-acetylglucosamine 4,6-dehydratase/5-epimerase
MNIINKKILIIGGTGSLGLKLVDKYINNNILYLYSRDECKHWSIQLKYNNTNLNFIIGNINDNSKIKQTLIRHNFDIIIMAAALKHIDKCENETNECINTNLLGTKNVLDTIECNKSVLNNLKSVCFVSTDKACSPVNIYGMSKAISETLMIEKSKYIKDIKFVCVRYGNVLNSRGSIIPILHNIGKDVSKKYFKLTDERMTRFVMTLEQSVELIDHALLEAESGDIVISKLISCNIKELIEIFSELYNKPIKIDKLRPGEKLLESLINETQSIRVVEGTNGYKYIKPHYKNVNNNIFMDYNSKINPLNKIELKNFLEKMKLINKKKNKSLIKKNKPSLDEKKLYVSL